jgi:predicted nucleic acid-binding protein
LVSCEELVSELRDVVSRPFFRIRLRPGASELLAAGIRDFSLFCRDLPSGPHAPNFLPDRKDSYLLALAEAGQADFLVSGDKLLLSLRHHKTTKIVTAAATVEMLAAIAKE